MRLKSYKLRGLTLRNGKSTFVDLDLEFEGKRAFAVWDSIAVGNYELKARLEIDPSRLQKVTSECCDFEYRGQLVLPRPQDN